MKFIRKHSDVGILIILWMLVLMTISSKIFGHYILGWRTLMGIGGLVTLTILRLITRKNFKIILGLFLLLGCFGLLQFTVSEFSLTFGKGAVILWFDPVSICLLAVLIVINLNSISVMHKNPEGVPEKPDPQSQGYLDKYYAELKEKEDAYLHQIITTQERWQKEYIQAAEKLLEERQQKS